MYTRATTLKPSPVFRNDTQVNLAAQFVLPQRSANLKRSRDIFTISSENSIKKPKDEYNKEKKIKCDNIKNELMLEEYKKLENFGKLDIRNKQIKSSPKLREIKELEASDSLTNLDNLEKAGVLDIKNTKIKSLPELKEIEILDAPATLGLDGEVGCPKLTSVKKYLDIENSNLSAKDFPKLIYLGGNKSYRKFYFQGNNNIKTIDDLLSIVNNNRQKQEKPLPLLKATQGEYDEYEIDLLNPKREINERFCMLSPYYK